MSYDTDDFVRLAEVPRLRQTFANRIFIWKCPLREYFVDDGNKWCRRGVLRRKDAAFDQLDAHRLEVAGADRVAISDRRGAVFRKRFSFDEIGRMVHSSERQPIGYCDRFHAGQPANILLQLFEE